MTFTGPVCPRQRKIYLLFDIHACSPKVNAVERRTLMVRPLSALRHLGGGKIGCDFCGHALAVMIERYQGGL